MNSSRPSPHDAGHRRLETRCRNGARSGTPVYQFVSGFGLLLQNQLNSVQVADARVGCQTVMRRYRKRSDSGAACVQRDAKLRKE